MGTRYGPVKLRVPKGFQVLLQRFSREVLREQPLDIARFGAEYFQQLLEQKLQTGEDPSKGDPYDEHGYKAVSERVLRPISSETRQNEIKQELAATKIQAGYRGYHVRRASRKRREEEIKKKHEVAATHIQANYRGYRTRKRMKNQYHNEVGEMRERKEEGTNEQQYDADENNAAIRIQANYRGYQARKSLTDKKDEQNEKEPIIDTNDPEVQAAASKIQASFRGHQARKSLKNKEKQVEAEDQPAVVEETMLEKQNEEESIIDTDDPEMQAAALKIQASFRGHKARKSSKNNEQNEEEPVIDTNDPEMESAALKIQASFRGHQARKSLKNNKDLEATADSEQEPGKKDEESGSLKMDEKHQTILMDQSETEEFVRDEIEQNEEEAQDFAEDEMEQMSDHESYEKREAAALKIQASYRGYNTRKNMKKDVNMYDVPKVEEADLLAGGDRVIDEEKDDATRIDQGQGDVSDHEESKEIRFAPEVTVEDTSESEDHIKKESAAVKIQAQYRGYKTRKNIKTKQDAEKPQASGDTSQHITVDEH